MLRFQSTKKPISREPQIRVASHLTSGILGIPAAAQTCPPQDSRIFRTEPMGIHLPRTSDVSDHPGAGIAERGWYSGDPQRNRAATGA